MRNSNVMVLLGAVAAIGIAGFMWKLNEPDARGGPTAPTTADIAAGKVQYAQFCSSCHGGRLQGQKNWQEPDAEGIFPAPPHDETGHTWHHADAVLFAYSKLGGAKALAEQGVDDFKSGMPGFGSVLTDPQIWNILAFIKSTWPERVRSVQAERTSAAQ